MTTGLSVLRGTCYAGSLISAGLAIEAAAHPSYWFVPGGFAAFTVLWLGLGATIGVYRRLRDWNAAREEAE